MLLRGSALAVVLVFTGCVPVTEPLTDLAKSEPDKALLGKWQPKRDKEMTTVVVDIPNVKGNPKGLMRATFSGGKEPPEEQWFFVANVGKHDYIQLLVDRSRDMSVTPSFAKEGSLEAWLKSESRGFWIGKYTIDKDSITIDGGREGAFEELMKREKFTQFGREYSKFYATPAGWLAKHLEKSGPGTIFVGKSHVLEYKRIK